MRKCRLHDVLRQFCLEGAGVNGLSAVKNKQIIVHLATRGDVESHDDNSTLFF